MVLDRINPSSEGVVRWVRTVRIDQAGLPGGLRAEVEPSYRPPAGVEPAGGTVAAGGAP